MTAMSSGGRLVPVERPAQATAYGVHAAVAVARIA